MTQSKTFFKTPYLKLDNYELQKEIVKIIPEEFARAYKIIAVDLFKGVKDILTIATSKPKNETVHKILESKTGYTIREFETEESLIVNAINEMYTN